MKPEEQKILNESLSKLFKIGSEKLAKLYNEAGDLTDMSPVMDADAERIQKFQSDKNDQYKRGVKEAAQKLERDIKEKYSVESELMGVELVDHILIEKLAEAKSSQSIEKHPTFLKARQEWEKEQKTRDKVWEKKLEEHETEFKRAKVFETVKSKALSLLSESKPILPADPVKAEHWKNVFLKELESGNYQQSDDGTILVLDKDGNSLKDQHGYSKTFNEFAKEIADKYFEYPVADDRSSAGLKDKDKDKGGGGGGITFKPPKNEDERLAMLRDSKITPELRKQITEFVIK